MRVCVCVYVELPTEYGSVCSNSNVKKQDANRFLANNKRRLSPYVAIFLIGIMTENAYIQQTAVPDYQVLRFKRRTRRGTLPCTLLLQWRVNVLL